jgi:predicted TIM-barrel fold metal-dependent hydrolase
VPTADEQRQRQQVAAVVRSPARLPAFTGERGGQGVRRPRALVAALTNWVLMTNVHIPSEDVSRIRARLEHPVIDSDGHIIEFLPVVRDLIVEEAGEMVARRFDVIVDSGRLVQSLPVSERRAAGVTRMPWWGIPTRNTLDRATAMLPALMYDRLDEIGIDVAFLYPTYGLVAIHVDDDELRQAMSRAFNTYVAEVYAPYTDRLVPVACIPTHSPQEAVAALEHAVGELGLRAAMMSGAVSRPIPGRRDSAARWIDGLGHASIFDYSPLWAKCVELGISPTFHATGSGWGSRTSPSNYVFNHIGNFAAAGELCARSLLFGGVPKRFPELRFAFLEGGTAWACNLYSDVLSHWEKRNVDAITQYDPAALDRRTLMNLFERHSRGRVREQLHRLDDGLGMLSEALVGDDGIDEFAESLLCSPDDVRAVFTEQYFFGCEADDPMAAIAFDTHLNPFDARLPAIFASDIGHWDVPDVRHVLSGAWDLVEHGHLDETEFKAFTFDHPVALWTGTNPRIFEGTVVQDAVRRHLDGHRGQATNA